MTALTKGSSLDRKFAAKRHNERLKLLASTANTVGLGILAAATIVPNFGQSSPVPGAPAPWWTDPLAFSVLFSIAFAIYRFMRSEG